MTKYGMVVEDHEVRLFPLANMGVLDIPEDRIDDAHDLEDEGDSDTLIEMFGVTQLENEYDPLGEPHEYVR